MFEYLLQPYKAPERETTEALELHQLAHEFKQEQSHREAYEAYCRRYQQTAQRHREEHAAMQAEPNLFAIFWKKKNRV